MLNSRPTFFDNQDCVFFDVFDDDDGFIDLMIQREKPILGLDGFDDWIRLARLDSIDWILKITAAFGFQFQTAYLSVTYLDQFLSERNIKKGNDWALPLLSVACLSLAAKLEEYKVPPLSEFTLSEGDDVYRFESNVVQRMELLVMSTLKWKMRLVTPFVYINYFAMKFCADPSKRSILVPKIVQIIMASLKDVNLMSHRPSVIACAATLLDLDSKLQEPDLELKINAHAPFPTGFLKVMDIVSCYKRMQELDNMENELQSPDLPRVRRSIVSGLSNKRKRLDFPEDDQNCGASDEKKLQ